MEEVFSHTFKAIRKRLDEHRLNMNLCNIKENVG
jgi:hypothetical protein